MASDTFWGDWVPSSSVNQRMRVSIAWSVTDPSPGQTSVTVSVTARLHAGYSFNWNGALMNRWGTYIGGTVTDESFHAIVPTNGSMVIYTSSRSVSLGSSASSLSIGLSVRNIGYVGPYTANAAGNIPIPAIPQHATPTNVSLTWPSTLSSNMRLTWSGGPIHEMQYRRRSLEGAGGSHAFNEWRAYSGVEQSSPYTISGVGGWYEYQFRIRRGTGSNASAWAYSNVLRQFLQPNKPTNIRVERTSDSRHIVRWDHNDTWDRPAAWYSINRFRLSENRWVRIAAPPRGSRSWVDTSAQSNDYIGYRVFAVNAWADIQSDDSAFIRTTPLAATNVVATRTGPNSALLEWTNRAVGASHIDIQAQTSSNLGVTWSGWSNLSGHTSISQAAHSRSLTGLNAALWYRFRVVHVALNNPGIPNLYGYSAATGIIRPANPPNPPTMLAPQGVVSSTEPVVFRWAHNATDGSTQTAYELRYRLVGDTTWTTITQASSGAEYRYVDLPDTGTYEAQVRTKGQHADWSGWSATIAFEVLDPPTVTITYPAPDQAVPSNRARVEFEYADATGSAIVRYRAELHRLDGSGGGEVIETRTTNAPSGETEIAFTFDTVLDNFAEYAVTVWATSGTGLESEPASVEFSTDFLLPTPPTLTGDWVESEGLARLAVTNHPGETYDGDTPSTVDTVHNRIERSTDLGQTWEPVADNMPLDVGLDDDMVPLNTLVWYRAIAVAEWGTEAPSNIVELDTATDKLWLMTMGSGVKMALECGLQLDPTFEQERISESYYGRPWPYSHYGEHRLISVSISATWAIRGIPCSDGIGTANDPHDLFGQDLWYRDPAGRAFRAGFTSGITLAQDNHWVQTVGFTLERVQV